MNGDKTETAVATANKLINELLDGLVELVRSNDEDVAKNVLDDIENGPYATIDLVKYLKGGIIKMELALGRGKKLHDKRQTMKKREALRDVERAISERT